MRKDGRDEEAAIRERVRIERSEHKRRDEHERLMGYVVPAVILVGFTAIASLMGAFK